MKYRFILTYQSTDSETTATRTCFPLHGDDLAISIDRAEGEWYYTRNLDGKLVFTGDDYDWIMGQEFDGTFTLDIKESHDNGATFYDYFSATFSRASLEIDEDNRRATLSGLKEGITDLVKNGAKEEYDLMKLIPDSYAKEVQGQVPPALALVDYVSTIIDHSDIFCDTAITAAGYDSKHADSGYNVDERVESNDSWVFRGAYACGVIKDDEIAALNGRYAGTLYYGEIQISGYNYFLYGDIYGTNDYRVNIGWINHSPGQPVPAAPTRIARIYDQNNNLVSTKIGRRLMYDGVSPTMLAFGSLQIDVHYIRATLLTQAGGNADNVLDTGDYYKRMAAFNNQDGGLVVRASANTSEQPNGHRMVPGSGDYGGIPQYYAPPDDEHDYIPLAEDNWNYGSLWYTIEPSIPNGLLDPAKFGSFRWTRCWTIGTCIQFLLQRITDGKVVFAESPDYSQFLYGNPNPVEGHEPFQWLVTQKSNVMRPSTGGASAARCPVKLEWFFELLRNAFNCYYWLEKVNGGTYNFRIEHVEYFRRGGAYNGDPADQLNLTRLKPVRNFLRNGQPAKRYADQTNRYTFDLDGMVEKYTYSWQGDGGGDDFKGNPMYFRAGWIEKGSSDDRQVDNIFADLGWLMLNAGTDTESSKNYDGLFIFGGYQPEDSIGGSASRTGIWKENTPPTDQYMTIAEGSHIVAFMDIWYTAPEGYMVTVNDGDTLHPYIGTGSPQVISFSVDELYIGGNHYLRIDFGNMYSSVIIHRIHARSGNVYYVPNVRNLLRTNTVNYLQNGCLAWPWLQCEYLHYDIPAAKWTYLKDDYTDNPALEWESDGTIKMVKKQDLAVVPVPDANTEQDIMGIMGIKTGLGIGIIDSAKINLSSRNAEMTIIYDINPQNQ